MSMEDTILQAIRDIDTINERLRIETSNQSPFREFLQGISSVKNKALGCYLRRTTRF
jgi:hypothetical protein